MRSHFAFALASLMLASSALRAQPPQVPVAMQLEREVERLAGLNPNGGLWPGFDPLAVPLAVYDGRQTYLFRHPSPPAGFIPLAGTASKSYVRDGRLQEIVANSSATIGGVSTATIMQMGSQQAMIPELVAPIAIHEAFHVYQRAHHKDWMADETVLLDFNYGNPESLTFRRLESEALRRALMHYDAEKSRCWTRTAIKYREDRFKQIGPTFAAYERGTELNEGLATYVEARSVDRIVEMPANEFARSEVRQRAYASGSAIATLLDRFLPRWKEAFERGDLVSLDRALADAAGAGKSCQFSAWEIDGPSKRSHVEADASMSDNSRIQTAFKSKPGWKLTVEVAGSQPLFPQGFDPLNSSKVGPLNVLHTRYLKAGNSLGFMEVLNAEALTESAGERMIAQGFRWVKVNGLDKPQITDSADVLTIKARGVSLQFRKASMEQTDSSITIKLRGP